jgi:muramidase (phage lysozyme)
MISNEYKAFLDTLAYTEGTLGVSNNGYDVVVNYHRIDGWNNEITFGHRGREWYIESAKSTAAGRYQFLGTTWWEQSKKYKDTLGLSKLKTPIISNNIEYSYNAPFTKENQDFICYKYLENKGGVKENDLKNALKSKESFQKMIIEKKLFCLWTSLARALEPNTDTQTICGFGGQAKTGEVKNKDVCGPNVLCKSGSEEIYSIFKKAFDLYNKN